MPVMALSGVLISWLMFARKALFAMFAVSAASLAMRRSRVWSSTRFLQVMSMPLQFEFVVLARRDVEDHPDQVVGLPARAVVAAAAFAHPEFVPAASQMRYSNSYGRWSDTLPHDPVDHRHIVGG